MIKETPRIHFFQEQNNSEDFELKKHREIRSLIITRDLILGAQICSYTCCPDPWEEEQRCVEEIYTSAAAHKIRFKTRLRLRSDLFSAATV